MFETLSNLVFIFNNKHIAVNSGVLINSLSYKYRALVKFSQRVVSGYL
jgi:hypothetical protein